MKPPILPAAFLALLIAASGVVRAADDLPALATAALAADADAVGRLRAAGPAGLDALFAQHQPLLAAMREGRLSLDDPQAAAVRKAVEAVARQRDAHAGQLYWYTDLEQAKAAARASGRPILSLRLLGNLDEEFSCANSRFFRTVLYANAEVSRHLREHFVLHWKSVRPAPRILIDMGDGRRLERTITGNSIHYVLDADGRILDALPGLYGPRAFLDALKKAGHARAGTGDFHTAEAGALRRTWLADAVRVGAFGETAAAQIDGPDRTPLLARLATVAFPNVAVSESTFPIATDTRQRPVQSSRQAIAPAQIDALLEKPPQLAAPPVAKTKQVKTPADFDPPAVGKSMVERPILRQTVPQGGRAVQGPTGSASTKPLAERMTTELWKKVAALHAAEAQLDLNSRRLMMAKLKPETLTAGERQTGGVSEEDTPYARTLRNFERAIAEDTVRNEYLYHQRLHEWLAPGGENASLAGDVDAFNTRVYADIFLTPDHDAWLGLVPDDTYSALENDGCACQKHATQ